MRIDRRRAARSARQRGENARAQRYEHSAFDRSRPRPTWMFDRTKLPKRPPGARP